MRKDILVVDDALFMRMMIKKAIAAAGSYRVIEAPGGEEALALYAKERPSLVFLDISMPGMNGIEVLKKLREADENAFVIMCSAIGQENMIQEAIESGAEDFIVKPFKEHQITEAVERAFSRLEEEP